MQSERNRCLVIGLDGAEPSLVWPWAAQGKLPNLAQLIQKGAHGPLRSTIPPISAAAWVTFLTGQHPSHHGVFDFRNYNPRKYSFQDAEIVSSSSFAGSTVLDVAGAHGRRVGAVTVPITYPAWAINGVMVSGYPTPDASKSFTHPPGLGPTMGNLTENSSLFRASSPADVLVELNRLTRARARATVELLTKEDYDLLTLVIGSTDRAHHDFWRHHDPSYPTHDPDEASKLGDAILQVYQEADKAVGDLLAAVEKNTTVIIMSDHGGGARPTWRFHTNAWLHQQGWLAARQPNPARSTLRNIVRKVRGSFPYQEQVYRRLPLLLKQLATRANSDAQANTGDIEWSQTQAYRFPLHLPVDGIVINVRGRQEMGTVAPGQAYEALRDQIIAALVKVRDPEAGQPVVVWAQRREGLYSGEFVDRMPDIVFRMEEDYEGGSALQGPIVTPMPLQELQKLSGDHRMDGILIASGPNIRSGVSVTDARIVDLAPTILYAMNLPIPRRMDGQVLQVLFSPDYLKSYPVTFSDWEGEGMDDWRGYSEDEEQELMEKLERLGYVG